jgi:hypothetical protein
MQSVLYPKIKVDFLGIFESVVIIIDEDVGIDSVILSKDQQHHVEYQLDLDHRKS